MPTDYAARLALVQAAINAILTDGMAEYQLDGQRVTKLDLAWLTREESRLEAKIARQSRRGGPFRTVAPR